MSKHKKSTIIKKPYDFYAIQCWCDGFGHDTQTIICYPSLEDAEYYVLHYQSECASLKIVGQYWGKEFVDCYD